MNKFLKYVAACAMMVMPTVTSAAVITFVVDAKIHSSNMLNGLATGIVLEEGEGFVVSADTDDVWFLGGLTTEYTNADGLADYPLYPQSNLTALYGTLVGQIGAGDFFEIGTHFTGAAANAGELFLYNWDSGNSENLDVISVTVTTEDKPLAFAASSTSVTAVPIPASSWLLISAIAGFGLLRRFS